MYLWADGLHFRVRLEQAHLCCLVLVGVRTDGTKELVAVADGNASRLSRGRSCCGICAAVACAPRW